MYHNKLCNFPTEQLQKKKCDKSCEHWVTCTRKNSYGWEVYLAGLKKEKPTNNAQKQRELMNREEYRHEAHRQELLDEIEKVNKILRRQKMTNEQAIQEVKNYNNYPNGLSKECREYIIKALEQPSDDCVSRADLIDRLEILDKKYGSDFYWEVRKIVDALSPVVPTHGTCKDCEHYRRIELNSCDEVVATCKKHTSRNYQYISPNFYCADFEKRGGEE